MLGPFPTWFAQRTRGKPYLILVRANFYPINGFGDIDPVENKHLNTIHATLKERVGILGGRFIQPKNEFIWTLAGGSLYYYHDYAVPFGWRKPFIKWLEELVGPAGVKPTEPNEPQPVAPPAPNPYNVAFYGGPAGVGAGNQFIYANNNAGVGWYENIGGYVNRR